MASLSFFRPDFALDHRPRTGMLSLALVVCAAAAWLACSDNATGPGPAVSASLIPAETAILHGDSVRVEAVVHYQSGNGPAETVAWSVSDSSILDLSVVGTGNAIVRGAALGDAYVIATINTQFIDSAEVHVTELSASLTPDTAWTIVDDSIRLQAVVNYPSGPRQPLDVEWSVSDSSVLDLSVVALGEASVKGLKYGDAYVLAFINDEYWDTSQVYVGDLFKVRWRVPGAGAAPISGPALDSQGNIYTIQSPSPATMTAVSPNGDVLYSVESCWADLAGNVLPDGVSYGTSGLCVKRHAPNGSIDWTFEGCSRSYAGIAVDSDGSVACANEVTDSVYRVSASGAELWRAPLTGLDDWRSAPAIASNGDVYIAWTSRNPFQFNFSRISNDGTLLWTVPSAGEVDWTSPAFDGDRIVLAHDGGHVTVYDTTGTIVWERNWTSGLTSSPVIDGNGNIYIQSTSRTLSYDANGTLRWDADWLRVESIYVPAPTLRADGTLLAYSWPGQELLEVSLCAVSASDGSIIGCNNLGEDVRGSPAVAPDGTIYVTVGDDLFALVDSIPPLTGGWPTEGGGMGRLRTQNQ